MLTSMLAKHASNILNHVRMSKKLTIVNELKHANNLLKHASNMLKQACNSSKHANIFKHASKTC